MVNSVRTIFAPIVLVEAGTAWPSKDKPLISGRSEREGHLCQSVVSLFSLRGFSPPYARRRCPLALRSPIRRKTHIKGRLAIKALPLLIRPPLRPAIKALPLLTRPPLRPVPPWRSPILTCTGLSAIAGMARPGEAQAGIGAVTLGVKVTAGAVLWAGMAGGVADMAGAADMADVTAISKATAANRLIVKVATTLPVLRVLGAGAIPLFASPYYAQLGPRLVATLLISKSNGGDAG